MISAYAAPDEAFDLTEAPSQYTRAAMWILNKLVPNERRLESSTRVGNVPLTVTKSDVSRTFGTRDGSDEPFTKSQIDSVPEWPRALSVLRGTVFTTRPASDQGETRTEVDLGSRTRMR